ncbi:MAG TPA: hypothetical protein VMB52_07080 [Verrucomicrobiae bacterium]|nr:hypothetical protein [Verrucomicrobiae bacterium]
MAEPARRLPEDLQPDIHPERGGYQGTGGSRPRLGVIQGGGESTPRETGHLSSAPSAAPDLEELEQEADTPPARNGLRLVGGTDLDKQEADSAKNKKKDDQIGGGYKDDDAARERKSKNKKRALVAGVLGGSLVTVALFILLLFLLLSLLKIPGLEQNITAYQFARTTRQAAEAADSVSEEDLAIEAAGDGGTATIGGKKTILPDVYGALKQKYQNLKDSVWEKLDNALPGNLSSKTIIPSKVIQTLQTQNGLSFDYTLSSTGRKILTAMNLNGETYTVEQVAGIAKWVPVLRGLIELKNQAQFINEGLPAISDALKANNVSLLVRGITANLIRIKEGISLKALLLSRFVGKNNQQADLEEEEEQFDDINGTTQEPDNATTEEIKDADKDVEQAEQTDANNPDTLKTMVQNDGTSPGAVAALNKDLEDSLTDKVVGAVSIVYTVAQPICIINDGAVANSGPSINNNTTRASASYYLISSVANEQEAGSPSASTASGLTAAVSAMNDQLANTNESPAYQRGYNNGYVDTSSSFSAESGADGSYNYSLLDALGVTSPGSTTGHIVNLIVSKVCPALTNLATAAGLGIVGILTSDGFSEAAGEAAGQSVLKFVQLYTTKIITGAITKKLGLEEGGKLLEGNSLPKVAAYLLRSSGKKYLLKNGTVLGLTVGLTEAAHLVVAERAGLFFSGANQGTDLSTEGDDGGNFTASQLNQTQEFGAPMTKDEVAESANMDDQYLGYQTTQQTAFNRYLSPNYANSLLVHVAMDLGGYYNGSFASAIMSLGSAILQPLHGFSTLFIAISGKASAAPDYDSDAFDYGNVQFGWTEGKTADGSLSEQDLINSDSSYTMANNQAILDASNNESAIASKYAQCFGYQFTDNGTDDYDPGDSASEMQLDVTGNGSIGTLLASDNIRRDSNGNVINGGGLCDPDTLSYNSSDPLAVDPCYGNGGVVDSACEGESSPQKNDMIMRWRLAMRYDLAADQLIHLQTVTSQ